jgi:hypothetical protein
MDARGSEADGSRVGVQRSAVKVKGLMEEKRAVR